MATQTNKSVKALRKFVKKQTKGLEDVESSLNPFSLFEQLIEKWDYRECDSIPIPSFRFYDEVKVKGNRVKIRHIGVPNESMRALHPLFQTFIEEACARGGNKLSYFVNLPSSAAFVKEKTPIQNVIRHQNGQYFYIVDITEAYDSVNMDLFVVLLTTILRYDTYKTEFDAFIRKLTKFGIFDEELLYPVLLDPLAGYVQKFVNLSCKGLHGGLVTGAPSSPYLFNVYCEILIDRSLRYECGSYDGRRILYSRYADDLVFSDVKPFWDYIREALRKRITSSGLRINHRKVKKLYKKQGTVFVTNTGIKRDEGIAFSQKKRRHLRGMIHNYFVLGNVLPAEVAGHIAHFKDYLNHCEPNKSDLKLWKYCKKFEETRARLALLTH